MKIPELRLKEYIQSHIIGEYDISVKAREQHDKDMEQWRKNRQ